MPFASGHFTTRVVIGIIPSNDTCRRTVFDSDEEQFDGNVAKLRDSAWSKRDLPFKTVIDQQVAGNDFSGKTSQCYRVVEWPTLIVIDPQGKVVGPVAKNKLADAIRRLLDEMPGK